MDELALLACGFEMVSGVFYFRQILISSKCDMVGPFTYPNLTAVLFAVLPFYKFEI